MSRRRLPPLAWLPIALLSAALAGSRPASAHPLAPSLLEIVEEAPGVATVRWKTPRKVAPGSDLLPVLPPDCRRAGEADVEETEEALLASWRVDCAGGSLAGRPVEVRGIAGSRTDVLFRVALADGRTFRGVLTAALPAFAVPERAGAPAVSAAYLRLGVGHILGGYDHLLFVLGLVLLVGRGRRLLGTITAFTLGHSVTLSLAALGIVHVPVAPVEAAIAFSIVLLAAELARGPEAAPGFVRHSPWLATGSFGLLHGLGFAGALSEVGLPEGEIPLALLSFNLGIEIGQVTFVLALLALAAVTPAAGARFTGPARGVTAYATGSLAAFWVLERLF